MELGARLNPVTKAFLAGSLSGTCSTVLFQPLDLVKTRQQAAPCFLSKTSSMLNVVRNIVATDTFMGLWRGMVPSLARTVPGVGLYFSSMHWMKSHVLVPGKRPSTLQTLIIGASARTFAASLVTHPADVVKTKMQLAGLQSPGVIATVRIIHRQQGITAFTVGLAPRLLRRTSMVALAWTVYEKMLTTMALK